MSLLEVRDLSVTFTTSSRPLTVVNTLNFTIQEAEVFGLVGESGCGKSLTALALMGLLPESARADGILTFKGRNLLSMDRESIRRLRGKEISMIFQEPMTSLNPVLTIGYQISEVITTHLGLSKNNAMEKTVELLRAVKIPSPEIRVNEYAHQMSGGMRQRVMIAMGIACNPSLLIADEPTTALDVTIEAQILELLGNLREERNMAVLLITHDIGVIAENADIAAIMYAGRIVELSHVSKVLENPQHPYTMGLLESLPKTKGVPLKPIKGSVPRPDALPQGCKFSDRCPYVIPDCSKEEPSLREITPDQHARCIRAEEITWESSRE
ncbi:MAG TPA: ABC transporter ATP-binding protein [Thermodesulfovibrionales bacterium]|nr:ABC transporter ATP-binding protein [Thermodesulfovibrionales bacterium]